MSDVRENAVERFAAELYEAGNPQHRWQEASITMRAAFLRYAEIRLCEFGLVALDPVLLEKVRDAEHESPCADDCAGHPSPRTTDGLCPACIVRIAIGRNAMKQLGAKT